MTQLVQADANGRAVYFEVSDATTVGPERISRRGDTVIAKLDQSLDQALTTVRPAAQKVLEAFTGLEQDSVEVEFGLTIDAEVGAVIAKAGATGHFTIKLGWKRPDNPT
jgi:hypothetical protein